ncbi:MAG: hypothetical protein Q7J10_00645 [Methanosarcinaceae archaeon]|nr:hypothetical protein [Methanosarcinaceae archaeon]
MVVSRLWAGRSIPKCHVVMYADKVTESMRCAIDKIDREDANTIQ